MKLLRQVSTTENKDTLRRGYRARSNNDKDNRGYQQQQQKQQLVKHNLRGASLRCVLLQSVSMHWK